MRRLDDQSLPATNFKLLSILEDADLQIKVPLSRHPPPRESLAVSTFIS
jgi:hypothetical protein